ncbi:molybdopterin cofactor-binding domain-containing protein [Acrocarpospora sp. B8E8]|uniref:xanthine dehydrogenase family protein molybdopterin-binding subunit n=1 Tax=Acrocarpospora sp. B8E8 TaxID=3153572 RepID=UPI00325F2693
MTRIDAPAKARGTARYAADHAPQDAAIAGLICTRSAHSRVRLDATAALAVPGVLAVLGPQDDPGHSYCSNPHGGREDQQVFTAEGRFAGDVVGAVVAENRPALLAALDLVVVEEHPLPAVLDVDRALDPAAPPAHLGFPGNLVAELAFGATAEEAEAALAGAPYVFDDTFRLDAGPVGFLEPPAAVAQWIDGTCHLWSTTQCPQLVGPIVARLVGVGDDRVVLHPVPVGGGFGGKEEMHLEAAAALCSRAVGGRAVSLEASRHQVSRLRSRHAATVRVRTGVEPEGRFLVRVIDTTFDAGPHAFHSAEIAGNSIGAAFVLYRAPVRRGTGTVVATNHTPAGAFRGYGGEHALFAVESQINHIARTLGIDPIELRRRNMVTAGDEDPFWHWPIQSFSLDRCLDELAARRSRPPSADDGRRRGTGIAALVNVSSATGPLGRDRALARCTLAADGTVTIDCGVADLGQGGHAVLVAIAQEVLPGFTVRLATRDTASAPPDPGVFASRGVYLTGNAVHLTARRLREAIEDGQGSALVRAHPAAAEFADGRSVRWQDIGVHQAEAAFEAPDNALAAGAQLVEVAVDPVTGEVEVERVVSVHDIGRVLDQEGAAAQVHGGVVQGIGIALYERSVIDADGRTVTGGFFDHLVPTSVAVPPTEVVFVQARRHQASPTGAKGLGECPILGVAPAIASAIADATGARLHQLPMTGERVADALAARGHNLEWQKI